jgi:hypothetical protein
VFALEHRIACEQGDRPWERRLGAMRRSINQRLIRQISTPAHRTASMRSSTTYSVSPWLKTLGGLALACVSMVAVTGGAGELSPAKATARVDLLLPDLDGHERRLDRGLTPAEAAVLPSFDEQGI